VSNGKSLFMKERRDGRSKISRRFKDLYLDVLGDLGGADVCSTGQQQIARRCATLSTFCEFMEAQAAAEDPAFDIEMYGMICDRLGRAFDRIGLQRVARPMNDGSDYLTRAHGIPHGATKNGGG
jgi:hypothetical protein